MITSLAELDSSQRYSYADYLTWKFAERIELLKGYIRRMAAPGVKHQKISARLTKSLLLFFENKQCEVFHAPFDVRLYDRRRSVLEDKEVYTVVQPDLCVVCDAEKLADGRGCNGAPDWIIEIISPASAITDTKDKFELYQEAGVGEYWIVYPNEAIVQQYVLQQGRFVYENVFTAEDKATSALFPHLQISMAEVFK
ncbi:MAG: Uma2 family endonuclease [Cytophagales bacterium]|nr:Uma2 family endonuclease [Bernardetiaceae bacterium]MDW8211526.1 Uma2 family endonuclease [Cytophagales bacterium]